MQLIRETQRRCTVEFDVSAFASLIHGDDAVGPCVLIKGLS